MYKAFEIATNMELISESDLEDWDAAITKGEAVRLFTTMSFMYYHVAGDGSLMDEIAENIIYPDVNPEDVDPKATNIDGDCRRIENTQEPAYNDLVHFCRRRGQTCQIVQSLSRWNDGIMIRDLLIIHVTCLRNILIGSLL